MAQPYAVHSVEQYLQKNRFVKSEFDRHIDFRRNVSSEQVKSPVGFLESFGDV